MYADMPDTFRHFGVFVSLDRIKASTLELYKIVLDQGSGSTVAPCKLSDNKIPKPTLTPNS